MRGGGIRTAMQSSAAQVAQIGTCRVLGSRRRATGGGFRRAHRLAKWKPFSLAHSLWRDARSSARVFDAVYRAESACRGGRTDVRNALEQGIREVAAR